MTVKAAKLVTSEEVIGEVVTETEKFLTLKNPVVVALQQTNDGRMAMGFLPFMPYIREPITISLDKVLVLEEVDESMKNQYNSVFGGIVTPPKTLITG